MKKTILVFLILLFTLVLLSSCGSDGTIPDIEEILNGSNSLNENTSDIETTDEQTTSLLDETTENAIATTEINTTDEGSTLLQFPAVTFADSTVVYDAAKHSILVSDSDLPSGTTVSYTYNGETATDATDVGTYTVRATLKNSKYEIKRLTATLRITPAQFPSVTFSDQSVEYDSAEHSIFVVGNLPSGTTITYSYNDVVANSAVNVGTYTIRATLQNANYETKILSATLRITEPNASMKLTLSNGLKELLNNYRSNLSDYFPATMLPNYAPNAINAISATIDYSSFVSTASIPKGGYGEQWHMVLDNLAQSEKFYSALNVIEGVTTSSIAAFDEYLDKNPDDTAFYQFAQGIYSITITNDEGNLYYVLDYSGTFPIFGEQQVQIALTLDLATHEKIVRIQIGDANALLYRMGENTYQFGIRYLGVRRAYFSLTRDVNGKVTGHINEFLEVAGKGTQSAADFYIENNFVTAIGNKAGGMIGFTGIICELYDKTTGKMLGYEVEETLSKITYNTLWFGFDQIAGINSIRYREKSDTEDAAFFVNGSSTAWAAKKVGGINLKTASRRFDIEFRTQYFYVFDFDQNKYVEVAVEVPMLFVQEEQYGTVVKDVKDTNGVDISILLPDAKLEKLESDYDTLLDDFKERKDSITSDQILTFIGEAKQFD